MRFWRSRRRVLALPWYWVVFTLAIGFGITALFVQADYSQRAASARALTIESNAAFRAALADDLSSYTSTTTAGAAFVDSATAVASVSGTSADIAVAEGFPAFARNLVQGAGPALRDFQLAPAGIVTYSADTRSNRSAIGHNLLVDDVKHSDIVQSVSQRQSSFTGPVRLLQGGQGVIARGAIFTAQEPDFAVRYQVRTGEPPSATLLSSIPADFWGFATAVIDFDVLMDEVRIGGTADQPMALDPQTMALTSRTGPDVEPSVIWGNPDVATDANPSEVIPLPGTGEWTLFSAVPAPPIGMTILYVALGVLVTLAFLLLLRIAYVTSARMRVGFRFGEGIVSDADRRAMLRFTADFLSEAYPPLRGRIRLLDDHDVVEAFGSPKPTDDVVTTYEIRHGGAIQAIIEITSATGIDRADLDRFIVLIDRILAANLFAAARRVALEEESAVDTLTQVFNRRHFQEIFEDRRAVAERLGWRLAVAVVDIDNFKAVNDEYGHLFGDAILTGLSEGIARSIRDFDAVFRFGGDEFVIICLMEHSEHADTMFHRIHDSANDAMTKRMPHGSACTASIGYYVPDPDRQERINELLARADQALYEAKDLGRDVVRAWHPEAATR